MEVLKAAALCAVCVLPVVLLRKQSPEQALLLTLAVAAVVLGWWMSLAAPVAEEIRELFQKAGVEAAYVAVLLKTVAAALITRFCADLCKDGGSQALASAVETAGAVAALAIAMPLLRAVVELLVGFF